VSETAERTQETRTDTQIRCHPNCECMRDDNELYRATERAYDIVFKGIVDFASMKAALDLNLFEVMGNGPQDLETLAQRTSSVPTRLEKLLVTMGQIDLAVRQGEKWMLSPLAEQFFTNPDQHRNLTMLPLTDFMLQLVQDYFLKLADVVRGKANFTSVVPHPPATREDSIFYETMHRSNIHFLHRLLRNHAQLQKTRHLIDVGGGIGDIAAMLCEQFPQMNVTLLNLPTALDLVRENAAERGLADRITPVFVDMYREPYPKGDAVMFSRILYPMNPQFCMGLIQKAYDALPQGGRVLILDMIISDPLKPNYDYLSHYLGGAGLDFSVLDFKDHGVYPGLLQQIGFTDITLAEEYGHVLYQAIKA
jgi:bacteriochlorophyll C20 methyltransferase